ncbi:CARD- and ANK-domain containing inflammasome adapter protein-like [Mytilus edulis]|uniref:CARD- and ANK-domain containing inflammasome adapter protein-like n=1 Tax=Mytilus edulis TaxID=6550 RepID=UPI0039EE6DE9
MTVDRRLPKDTALASITNEYLEFGVLGNREIVRLVLIICIPILLVSVIALVLTFQGDCLGRLICTADGKSNAKGRKYFEDDTEKVPYHVQDYNKKILQDWGNKIKKFVITRASEFICKRITTHPVIVIAGPHGAGKSANAYYAAFRLKNENGYTIIPARQPVDIMNYHVPGTKQIFIIDDFIGKYSVDDADIGQWEKHWPLLDSIFSKTDDIKLILTSRTCILQPERCTRLGLGAYTCDFLSCQIRLSLAERWDICQSYLTQVDIKALKDETLMMYSFFPSLCSSYKSSESIPVAEFFTAPYQIIEEEIDNFRIKSQVCYFALAILSIKETISKSSFSIDHHEYDELLHDVFHESDFLQCPSKNSLKSSLVDFIGTYVKVVKNGTDYFMFIDETLQNIVLRCSARYLIKSAIKYCKTKVLLNQIRLNCFVVQQNVFSIEVSAENEETYFRRLVLELSKGWHKAIFENEQNKILKFRLRFLKYMKRHLQHDTSGRIQTGLLHVVSALGYKDYVIFFLKDKTIINQKDNDGNIPLHLACMNGQTEIVEYLVRKKSSIDVPNNDGLKPFACACIHNNIAVVKFLLHHCSNYINVNEKYRKRNDRSVLHIVSAKGFANIVLLLLEDNADVDGRDEFGCTPLHLARDSTVVNALLAFNANINAIDSYRRSPLYLACGSNNERVIQLLIEKKADINQKAKHGLGPIHAACQSGCIGIVKILLENGSTVNRSTPGIVPLHYACKIGNESITNILIAANASVNHQTKYGETPLHIACMNERVVITQILLDNKANVNEADKYGWTALFVACVKGFRTVVDLLLQHGANVNICDKKNVSPLVVACKENKTDVVDLLLCASANVNHCDRDNCSSLLFACKTGNVHLVNLLLTYGADMNLADKDMITPLHAACMSNNNTKLVLKLVENNANINVADKTGQTPLFKATSNCFTDIVDILLRHGASVDIRDKSGNSALAIAEKKGHTAVVDVFRKFKHDNQII